MTPTATQDPAEIEAVHRRWIPWILGALLVVIAARFVRLDIDPPYGVVSDGGEFLSDEGWYTQAAQLHARFGHWTNDYDLVWFSGNALFSFIYSVAFEIAGSTILVARTVSVLASCVTLLAFYAIVRTALPRIAALTACLVAAVTLHNVGYSRIAIIEPTGVAVSMLALLAWVRLPRVPASLAGLLLGTAAYFVKASFLFTLCVMAVLAMLDTVVLVRERRWIGAVSIVAALVVAPFLVWSIQQAIDGVAPQQAAIFAQWHVNWRVGAVLAGSEESTFRMLVREARYVCRAFVKLPLVTNTLALAATVVAAGAVIAVRTKLRPGVPRARAMAALIVWFLAGTTCFGLFDTQPIRYFLFAVFPLAFFAVAASCAVVPARKWILALACLFVVHVGVQIPGYMLWLGREDLTTAKRAAEDAVSHMTFEPGADGVGVIGDTASFLSLYDERIRPLTFRDTIWLGEKVARWRPRYFFDFPSRSREFVRVCSDMVERVEPLASYRIMGNYCVPENFALYRIVYRQ